MSHTKSCSIAVFIDRDFTTGLVRKGPAPPQSKLFYADHDKPREVAQALIHYLRDHKATAVTRLVLTLSRRLSRSEAVRYVRCFARLHREIGRREKPK